MARTLVRRSHGDRTRVSSPLETGRRPPSRPHSLWLLIAVAVTGLSIPAQAQQVDVFGFGVFNTVPKPAEVPISVGDLVFSDDGGTALFIGGSEYADGGVWSAPVNRDAHGDVTSFGTATELFPYPNIDSGLERYPGSSTFFFTVYDVGIAQRTLFGAVETKLISEGFMGGLAVIPPTYPNSPGLIVGDCDGERILRYTVADDGDGTYTLGDGELFASMSEDGATDFCPGDVEYILTGRLAGSVLVAAYTANTVYIVPIDPATGQPIGGDSPVLSRFASLNEIWGLGLDPVTHNIWLVGWGFGPLVQVAPAMFADDFESGDMSDWSSINP